MEIKTPDLKLRYSKGLGDVVACFLHSKPIGWITFFITGKKKPCSKCSKKREALNTIFPFALWRLFFKNTDELLESLKKDYEAIGYNANIDKKSQTISTSKFTGDEIDKKLKENSLNIIPENTIKENNIKDYIKISSSDSYSGDLLIKIEIYKKK